jgi:hypothetical protein
MTKLNNIQKNNLSIILINFICGMALYAYVDAIQECLVNGLWHKIINSVWLFSVNIPIGFISMIFLSISFGIIFVMVFSVDYVYIYKNKIKNNGE